MEKYKVNCFVLDKTEKRLHIAVNGSKITSMALPSLTLSSSSSIDCAISAMSVLASSTIVIFCGSVANSLCPPTKAIFYDLRAEQDIYTTLFSKPIKAITSVNKCIFFEVQGNELNVFKYENASHIAFISKLSLSHSETFVTTCLIWPKTVNDITRYNIAYVTDNSDIGVLQYFDRGFIPFSKGTETISSTSVKSFQNLFYDEALDTVFIVEGQGRRVEEVFKDNEEGYSVIRKYYRARAGYICDIRSIKKDYVAMASNDRTILVFFYGMEDISIGSIIIGMVNQGIMNCLKIDLNEEGSAQGELPQRKKEVKLLFDAAKKNELRCFDSSGVFCAIKVDYNKKIYSFVDKKAIVS